MNGKLLIALKSMNETDYHVLALHMQSADMCRKIMDRFGITDALMATKLGLTAKEFANFKKGAYEYSISDLAKMQAIQVEQGIEELRFKIEKQVQFPDYKFSKP